MAGGEDARLDANTRIAGFAVLHRLIRQATRRTQRGDAIGQEVAALLFAEIALAMAVIFDQARHGDQVGRLDRGGAARRHAA